MALYEYKTTTGPRKMWDDQDTPPEGEGWVRDMDQGRDGWERFDYHEESYWKREVKVQTDPKRFHAYQDKSGEIDLDSIAEDPVHVRDNMLRESMGWRYKHPDRYPHDEQWELLLKHGSLVEVTINVIAPQSVT